jgi:hypothetical protein
MLRVKLIKNVNIHRGPIIPKGEVCNVRVLQSVPFQINPPYQIIDGDYSGHVVSRECCIEVSNEKTFTEDEVKAIEAVHLAKLEKLSAEKDRAIDLVTSMSKQMVKKNAEIKKLEFYVSALSIGLSASSEAIQVLREKEIV